MKTGQNRENSRRNFPNAPYGLIQPAKAITRRWEACMTLVIA